MRLVAGRAQTLQATTARTRQSPGSHIHHRSARPPQTPKQPQLASYYTRLTQIFAVSDSPMYHAFAWLKLFSFARQHARGMSQTDYQQMATAVLLAALAILPYERSNTPGARGAPSDAVAAEQEKERANRMATILGFAVVSPGAAFDTG